MRRRALMLAAFSCAAAELGPDHFSTKVYPVFQGGNCRVCHTQGGLAAATRLRMPAADAGKTEIEEFGARLGALIDRGAPERSPLLMKPTNREQHTGGQMIRPDSAEARLLLEWVRHLAAKAPEVLSKAVEEGPLAQVRRLTHSQYNNTVRDLIGDRSRPADRFPPEDFVHGFKNQSAAQDISPLLAEAYNKSAERLARNAFPGNRDENKLLGCQPKNAVDRECAASFVRSFGARAFRRPLTSSEQSRYLGMLIGEARRTGQFLDGARLVMEAMLQSPKFLLRPEDGAAKGYEIATRLSYFLWDTMPDQELFRGAQAGELSSRAGVERTARRMLADPRAREAFDEFLSQWLRFDLVLNSVKDRRLFPQFNEELGVAMTEETRRLISDLTWNDGNFMDIFTARHSFLNAELASLYGLPALEGEFARVEFPVAMNRRGILAHALFLALTSKPGETAPTVRGFFVREHFLCQTVPDPPPGTNSNLPPILVSRPQTIRQRLEEHVTNPSCAGCHRLMDPIGFGLEQYDAIGRQRAKDRITFFPTREGRDEKPVTVDLELDATGEVSGIADSKFSGPAQLGEILARSELCQECIVRQLFRYAAGRHEAAKEEPVIARGRRLFRESRYRLKELMIFLAGELATEARE
ncbi:MAG: DUF1592 domain-containing protein [Acidimicrobiia bacterium]|nr:DUF1592 domain-containing protein [Acidimicrobiia bacterium]